jgi:hypothetical protein
MVPIKAALFDSIVAYSLLRSTFSTLSTHARRRLSIAAFETMLIYGGV